MVIKLLLGGSPCTHWSIAQSKDRRETHATGLGWELFENYLIAKEKFKPNLFLYENVSSASKEIKEQIKYELGVGTQPNVRFTELNSSLVSAQQRKRFYVTNFGDITTPLERGIVLADVLETNGIGISDNHKAYCLTANYQGAYLKNTLDKKQRTMVAQRVGIMWKQDGTKGSLSQGNKIYSINGKSATLTANGGGKGAKTGLYAISESEGYKCYEKNRVYEVKDNLVEVNGIRHKINVPDGYYTFRKLSVRECERLQTLPDGYCDGISDTQAYKCLGNGWTAEVIIHLLKHAFQNINRDEKILVLSMYDGIATGRYCLDKLGFKNIEYHAFEIDKYAMQIAKKNYPDIIYHGDAFLVRKQLNIEI